MEPGLIKLSLSTNADLHDLQPVIDDNGVAVDMTGWPFKLQLKSDENAAAVLLTVTVTVNGAGELLLTAAQADINLLLTAPVKKRRLVGDLLTKPTNTYIARLARVEAILERGTSSF